MKRLIHTLTFLLGALHFGGSPLYSQASAGFDFDAFGKLPVVANGRVKPLDSVARNSLLLLQGRQSIKTPSGESLTPIRWLLDVFFRPGIADTYQDFEIVHPDLLDLFNLSPEDGAGKKRFSYSQLEAHLQEVDRQASLAESVEGPNRNSYQRAVLNLRDHIILYQQLKHSLVMPDGGDFLGTLTYLQDHAAAAVEAVRAREDKKPHDEKLAAFAIETGGNFLRMEQIGNLLAIPPLAGDDTKTGWQKTGQALLETFQAGSVNPYALTYAGLAHAWVQQNPQTFNKILGLYRAELQKSFPSSLKKTDVEVRFNATAPFYYSMYLYVLAFLLAIISWLKWPRVLQKTAFYLILLAWIATTAGIITRMWLEGRPPVTNLYSSALFVGWGSVGLCLILERIYKNGIGSVTAGLAGFCTLLIAHHLALSGDTLEMMRAVLDSNFWLATHVVVVTTGYAATFLSGFLAIVYIVRGMFTRSLDKATADALARMVYGIVCFATLFSLVGTILGGIWADQSWGRFWGWDPKENGALIIVIWNAIILHARWGGLVRQRGLMVLAVFGNIVTSWSWFGVNMLGVGLHSYGFMDAAFWWLIAFVASQLTLIALAQFPLEKWLSFRSAKNTA
ncbi:MAG TPA: cytochrome c biogenesis protein CcsA [Rariglobus sp.]|jgi:ABC-type transport system involved in cytochrome c biogenesis permease subunit|nr:cytochrome c biogenesis protein CcsA [Rariglobus sp.]